MSGTQGLANISEILQKSRNKFPVGRILSTRITLAAVTLAGCAGSPAAWTDRGHTVHDFLLAAARAGAARCAPRELALARAHADFAQRELEAGEYFRAGDHLQLAEMNAREAQRLSPDLHCKVSAEAGPGCLNGAGAGCPGVGAR
jgi:OOP family OmpA-OmpF porin